MADDAIPYWVLISILFSSVRLTPSLAMTLHEVAYDLYRSGGGAQDVFGDLVNGKVRQACTALIDQLDQPVTLEPMTKFPLVRDLFVDRQRLFEDLKRVKAWVPIDGTHDLGPGPAIDQAEQEERYPLSRCISCGCCLEACPQYTAHNKYVGAAVISQVKLFNTHPIGAALKDQRLDVMMEEGGISDCSKAGNCVEVCPKDIPNLESIAAVGRQTFVHSVKRFFSK
jgi:succinate dehydrogenase / fumarate reductase iron-sulfur subunit